LAGLTLATGALFEAAGAVAVTGAAAVKAAIELVGPHFLP
jgi:hypothetical protein